LAPCGNGALVPFVALATCQRIPEPDADEDLLVRALASLGVEGRVLAWDGDPRRFDGAARVVVRSTWNYYLAIDRFLQWIDAHAQRIENAAPILRWNAHKRYLEDLEREGLPIVPTAWFSRGETVNMGALAEARGWRDVVVKPAVSAGSYSTRRFASVREATNFASDLGKRVDILVQPYMASVEQHGERSIICIDGAITHSVRKSPRFSGGTESVTLVPVDPEARRLAERVLSRFPEPPLYARVDVVRGDSYEARLSEVELIEPSLFLCHSEEALTRFARAIAKRVL
jgi:hypothetical protein